MANATEWRERVAAWRASGQSAEEFCADRGYSARTMWQWSSRLGRSKGGSGRFPKPEQATAEPAVAMARLVRTGEGRPSSSVVVELNGARIEVQGAVPATTLRAVFDSLREAGGEWAP